MKTSDEMFTDLVERRDRYVAERARKRRAFIRRAAPVCCICLVAALGVGVWQSGRQADGPGQGDGPLDEGPGQALAPAVDGYAVHTDPVWLPEDTSMFDMIGCVVYKGSVYTQSGDLIRDPEVIEGLVGECVGEAKCSLDEWSTQEDWATELASTYYGQVYTVNGYSEDFRLCIYVNWYDEKYLQLLDNYDGIGLNVGADVFEDRLHIKGNVEDVRYLKHYDWNNSIDDFREPDVTQEQFERFLDELDASPFVRVDHVSESNFYNTEPQGHLYLYMSDGTVVELRLIDGGYVNCQSMFWTFVKMPGEVFDLMMGACQ